MKKIKKLKRKINNYLFDHRILASTISNVTSSIFAALSGIIFAFGFTCFITPSDPNSFTIITGGASGISQNIVLIFALCGLGKYGALIQSICYFAINVPILVFAFFMISKRFALITVINVLVSSLFISIFPTIPFIVQIQDLIASTGGMISRILFAAVCTGLSSAISFRVGASSGGVDVFTYYFATRKSTSVGKYAILINGIVVTLYTILFIVGHTTSEGVADGILSLFYAIVYLFITSLVIDKINIRNKKVQIQIITDKEHLPQILIANFPHSATVLKATGAYTQKDKLTIYMVVSSIEVKMVTKVVAKADPHSFVSVFPLSQVYGNFYIKPID